MKLNKLVKLILLVCVSDVNLHMSGMSLAATFIFSISYSSYNQLYNVWVSAGPLLRPEKYCHSTVEQWLAPTAHSRKVPGLRPDWGLTVWSLFVCPFCACVGFLHLLWLPCTVQTHVRLFGDSKFTMGVNVSADAPLSLFNSVTCPPMMWKKMEGWVWNFNKCLETYQC